MSQRWRSNIDLSCLLFVEIQLTKSTDSFVKWQKQSRSIHTTLPLRCAPAHTRWVSHSSQPGPPASRCWDCFVPHLCRKMEGERRGGERGGDRREGGREGGRERGGREGGREEGLTSKSHWQIYIVRRPGTNRYNKVHDYHTINTQLLHTFKARGVELNVEVGSAAGLDLGLAAVQDDE